MSGYGFGESLREKRPKISGRNFPPARKNPATGGVFHG